MVISWLQQQWRGTTVWQALLTPLSWLFAMLSGGRRLLYRLGVLSSQKLPVPVIVVGNISVGGTGKTPLVIWLAEQLASHGWRPGIISRGYGGHATIIQAVNKNGDARVTGDEPLLLAQRLPYPVWIGASRAAAGQALLAAHPDTDILISDDGLQHLGLVRDYEIAVVDARCGFGNGRLLPAGPLREAVSRLARLDAIVINQTGTPHLDMPVLPGSYAMRLTGSFFYNLKQPQQQAIANDFQQLTIHAVAGIGNPQRFFEQLTALGMDIIPHAFADHHQFQANELNFAGIIIMTEKDAVKCLHFATEQMWVWPVHAQLDPELIPHLLAKLGNHHG